MEQSNNSKNKTKILSRNNINSFDTEAEINTTKDSDKLI